MSCEITMPVDSRFRRLIFAPAIIMFPSSLKIRCSRCDTVVHDDDDEVFPCLSYGMMLIAH